MIIDKRQRTTFQNTLILNHLKQITSHPSAESVYKEIKKSIPTITLATVYRNLNKLAQNETIIKLEVNKEFRFDGNADPHQHLVCTKCKTIYDVFIPDISNFAITTASKATNIQIQQVNIIFKGICKKCLEE